MSLATVILSYNHPNLTEKCVRSALVHREKLGLIYLVHNGSQPETVSKLQELFPDIQHLAMDVNRHYSGGANVGIKKAFDDGAERVFFLTNDTVLTEFDWSPGPTAGFLLAPRIERRQTGEVDSLGGSVCLSSGALRHLKTSSEFANAVNPYVPGTAFLIDKKAWVELSEFDESLGTYWEDVDLSIRAKKSGIGLGVTEKVVLTHGVGKTCHKDPKYSVYYFQRNRRRVVFRHGHFSQRIQFRLRYTFEMSKKFARYGMRGDLVRLKFLGRAIID